MDQAVSASHTIADVLAKRPVAARVFLRYRMGCLGCAIASFETLAEACAIYGVPVEHLLVDLDAAIREHR
jgi:hybrid cluster-associated redox disulfide protein